MNGLAERFVRTFKQRYLSAKNDNNNSKLRLQRFLISYRNTPQSTTHRSPAELLIGRRLPTLFDRIKPDVRSTMEKAIWKQKSYHDQSAKMHEFNSNDTVWVRNNHDQPGWQAGQIQNRTGELSYEVMIGGKIKRKHADQLQKREGAIQIEEPPSTTKIDGGGEKLEENHIRQNDPSKSIPQQTEIPVINNEQPMAEIDQNVTTTKPVQPPPQPRHSNRERNPPKRLIDEI